MIEETIAKLEAAVAAMKKADPAKKAELLALLARLKKELRSDEKEGVVAAGEDLSAAVREFESTHPELVTAVNELCTLLSGLGI